MENPDVVKVKVIKFDKEQMARLTVALRAAAAESVQPEDDNKAGIHEGKKADSRRRSNENMNGVAAVADSCEFFTIKEDPEVDTLDNTLFLPDEILLDAKYLLDTSVQQPSAPLAPAGVDHSVDLTVEPNDSNIATSVDDINVWDSKSNDALHGEVIKVDDNSDEEETGSECHMQVKKLIESDEEHDVSTTILYNSFGKGVKICNDVKQLAMMLHYVCPQCNQPFKTHKRWQVHTFNEHNFNSIEHLNLRKLADSEGRPYHQCKDCPKKFKNRNPFSMLLDHRITHLPYANYIICRLCNKQSSNRKSMLDHVRRVHTKVFEKYINFKPKSSKYVELYCPLCYERQPSRQIWKTHLDRVHNYSAIIALRMPAVAGHSDLYSCKLCDGTFLKEKCLEHAVSHERYESYKCKLCSNFTSSMYSRFWLHVGVVHVGTPYKMLPCPYCELVFTMDTKLKQHMLEVHRKYKLKCGMCNLQFYIVSSLMSHMTHSKHHPVDGVRVEDMQISAVDESSCETVSCSEGQGYDEIQKGETEINANGSDVLVLPNRTGESHAGYIMTTVVKFPDETDACVVADAVTATNYATAAADSDEVFYVSQKSEIAQIYQNFDFDINDCDSNSQDMFLEEDDEEGEEIIELSDSSDDEAMDVDTDIKFNELVALDVENSLPATQLNTRDGSVVTLCQSKNIDMLMDYLCPQCNHSCGSFKKWQVHTFNAHNFNSIEELNMRNIVDHSGKICYQCKDCNGKLNQRMQYVALLNHRITHMSFPNYLKCRLCNACFPKRNMILCHLRSKHRKVCKEYLTGKPSLWHYMHLYCPLCNALQPSRKHWETHLNMKHNYSSAILAQRMPEFADTDGAYYYCIVCRKKVRKRDRLEHAVAHERYKPYKCKVCPNYRETLVNRCWLHMREAHLDVPTKNIFCPYCEFTFPTSSVLSAHLRDVHLKQKLQCKMCELQFVSATRLIAHMNKNQHFALK